MVEVQLRFDDENLEKKAQFLSASEVQELLSAIENPTLKLMVRLCLQTGIRRKELLLFPLSVIRKANGNQRYYEVNISGKGEKERKVHIIEVDGRLVALRE